jgi:hypothetical protein
MDGRTGFPFHSATELVLPSTREVCEVKASVRAQQWRRDAAQWQPPDIDKLRSAGCTADESMASRWTESEKGMWCGLNTLGVIQCHGCPRNCKRKVLHRSH